MPDDKTQIHENVLDQPDKTMDLIDFYGNALTEGEDVEGMEYFMGRQRTRLFQGVVSTPADALTDMDMDRTMLLDNISRSMTDQGDMIHASEVKADVPDAFMSRVPTLLDPVFTAFREEYSHLRKEAAIAGATGALEMKQGTWLNKAAAKLLQADATQFVMAGVDPLMRMQQTAFALLKGDGFASFSRLRPSYVLEEKKDETGEPIVISPFQAAIDAAWADSRMDTEGTDEAMVTVRSVNEQHMGQLIQVKDIPDAWFGKETMDQYYMNLSDTKRGQLGMATLATGYALGEIFLDPLLLFNKVPTLAVKGLRKLATPISQAKYAETAAIKTNTIVKLQEAVDRAGEVVEAAKTEATRHNNSMDSMVRLANARKFLAEREDALLARRALGADDADFVHMNSVQKRDPSTISTVEVKKLKGTIRGKEPAWKQALEHDMELAPGRFTDDVMEDILDGEGAFINVYKDQLRIEQIGKAAVGDTHQRTFQLTEMLGEKLGFRVIPYKSSGYLDAAKANQRLAGSSFSTSRTVYLNLDRHSGQQVLETFFHEAWHQTVANVLRSDQHAGIIDNLLAAGFPVGKYADDLKPLGYNLDSTSQVVEEFTARSITDLMTKSEFWDTLRKINPQAFDDLAGDSMTLAMESRKYIDNLGGKRPREWATGSYKADDIAKADMHWYLHGNRVSRAIELARKQGEEWMVGPLRETIQEVDDLLKRMIKDRDQLQARGEKTPLADKSIDQAEKYLGELETTGVPAMLEKFDFEREVLYTRTVDEVRAIRDTERRIAAIRQTTEIQPRRPMTEVADDLQDELFDRIAAGPDDAEVAAEGMGRLVHGASPDDITIHLNNVPERAAMAGGRVVPGTAQSMIDMTAVQNTLKHHKLKMKAKQPTLHGLDPEMVLLDRAYKKAMKENGGKVPFDDAWLPQPRKTTGELLDEGWDKTWMAENYDRISRGLYPNTWKIKSPNGVRAAVMFMREPMRVMEAVDPGKSWPILRAAKLNSENESLRLSAIFDDAAIAFGALEIKNPSKLRQLVQTGAKQSKQKRIINQEKNEQLMEILQTSATKQSKKYAKLTEELTPDQRQALASIRREFDTMAERFGIRGGDLFIEDYMPHVFDASKFSKSGIAPEYMGMSRNGNIFMANLIAREGADDYVMDAVAAMDLYSRAAGRKMHMEPALDELLVRAKQIAMDPNQPENSWYLHYANMMAAAEKGEASLIGQWIDSATVAMASSTGNTYKPGGVSRSLMSISGLMYASLLAGNRRYPVMSVATALATTGAEYGMYRTTKGMFKMATPEGQLVYRSVGGDKTWGKIFEADGGIGPINTLTRNAASLHLGAPSIESTENFIRGMTFWAAIDENLSKLGFKNVQQAAEAGYMREIAFDSLVQTEKVNHFFGINAKPPIMARGSKSGAAVSTQFLSFTPKQAEQLLSMAGDNPGKIGQYMMLSGWIGRVGIQDLGIDITEYVGMDAIKVDSRNMVSPGIDLLVKMADHMQATTAMMDGYGSAEDAVRAGDEFLKSLEVMVPLLNRSREVANAAKAEATGEAWSPTSGKIRDMDLEYLRSEKGERGESVAVAMGVKSVVQQAHQDARKKTKAVINRVALEKLAIIEDVNHAISRNDWGEVEKQIQKMADAGFPVPDVANRAATVAEMRALSWHINQIKRNPAIAHKLTPILLKYGIIKTGEPTSETE